MSTAISQLGNGVSCKAEKVHKPGWSQPGQCLHQASLQAPCSMLELEPQRTSPSWAKKPPMATEGGGEASRLVALHFPVLNGRDTWVNRWKHHADLSDSSQTDRAHPHN